MYTLHALALIALQAPIAPMTAVDTEFGNTAGKRSAMERAAADGIAVERAGPERAAAERTAANGTAQNGTAQNDTAQNDTAQNDTAANGTAANGTADNGTAADGAAADGAAADGAAADGTAADGAAADGAAVNRTAANGAVTNGAVANGAVTYGTEKIDGLDIFYREAGRADAPQLVLLHGFPTSSHMFRNLIPALSDQFHIIAPDYPGYGLSSMPSVDEFDYSFDSMAGIVDKLLAKRGFERYSIYLMDYGAPIGFRLAEQHPERVAGLIIQNGNAYDEGLREFWDPIKAFWKTGADAERDALRGLLTIDATKWQYQHGTQDPTSISPDNWLVDQPLLDRSGNDAIQLAMFYDYRTNVTLYPQWQRYFREHQPPTLIVWGKNDQIFPAEGAHPYLRDLPKAELHLLDTGHFALEEEGVQMAKLMRRFLTKNAAH